MVLPKERREQIFTFSDVFSKRPGLCPALQHKIVTTPDFKPKAFKAYRIPQVWRDEVDRQIDQLLEWGFIKPSDSPMATPMVCALKKDQSIRLAVKCTEHPGACTSQKLSTAQHALSVVICGSYAVIWGLQKFRDMIFGSQAKNAPKSAELMRWLLAIQEFNVEIVYKGGVG